jgi:microcystin degradation protein MlrC
MKIAIGSLMQETNTFASVKTTLETFRSYYLLYGDELFTGYKDARVEVPGFIDVLREANVEITPLIAGFAASSGVLTRSTFDQLVNDLTTRLQAALPVDGVLLALHGAMCVEDEPDAEGEMLEKVRAVVGAEIPIGVSLDLHAHVTPRMIENATFIIGYQNYPHTDMYETGIRTARLILDTLHGRYQPKTAIAKRPMVLSPVNARTLEGPLKIVADVAREMERSGRTLHGSLFPVQPWMDIPDLGFGVIVVADKNLADAQAAADELAEMAWAIRADCEPDLVPLYDAIRIALEAPEGLTVVGDAGDAPSGGAAADNIGVLKALLEYGADRVKRPTFLTLCDAEAAQAAAKAGIGSEITLRVGHKLSTMDGEPLTITGRVRLLAEGTYLMSGAGSTGLTMNNGLTAVIAIGNISLCVRSLPAFEWDPAMYASLGLDLRTAALAFVKSPSHFRATFGPIADRILIADTPGPTCANMRKVKFTRVTRPLYPLDEI